NIASLAPYQAQRTFLLNMDGVLLDDVAVLRLETDERGRDVYLMLTNPQNTSRVKSWLRGLSDGYILFDDEDVFRKVEGPAVIEDLSEDALQDPVDRLVSLAVVGPGGPELLQKLGMPPLSEGAIWRGQVAGIPVLIARLGYGVGDVRLEMLVHPDQAAGLWAALIEAGATPRGDELRRSLRARADLPDYANERPTALELYQGPQKSWFCLTKPYFVGQASLKPALTSLRARAAKKQEFVWREPENAPLKRTPLYNEHRKRTTKLIPFAGWEMPVWYSSVSEEHQAVRSAAGLFDVAHMGVLEVSGEHAASFLDVVASNYARWIDPGQSAYAYFLDPDGNVIDDFMMYRLGWDRYLLIVNAV
ncbi:MAG: hypothetical protein H5T63_04770, partial [Chloroflexi bacterium]|nr:hypothetical protein [Chloroflexota bacterium]